MIKSILINQYQYHFGIVFFILLFSGFKPQTQQKAEIILQDERLPITPKEFYVANVVDERDNRTAVAWLLPAISTGSEQPKAYPVDLKGGGLVAVKQFIDRNLPRNTALRSVVIGLKKFTVTETALAGGRVEGHVALVMTFYLKQEDDEPSEIGLHLADYNGSAVYNRPAGPPQEIEPTLRHLLESGLNYLNTWMDRQANNNIKLAKSVKISFTDYLEKTEGDTIYYSTNRPLTWADFQSKVENSRYDAEIFASIGYDERTEVIKGVVNITMAVKVFVPKSACWAKEGSRNDYTLNHEQRHFEIAKIASEHLKQKLKTETLPVGNFDGPINMDYLDTYREMDELQKQYDNETNHGSNRSEQQRWNERIDKELKQYSVVISH
ncbi:MAG TPA: hypothetical protein VGI43_14125 [Mucilaginibacter sp.]|jgi:hypothetical protein